MQRGMLMFQKMKLSTKLAMIIAGVLAIILIVLSACSIAMSQSAIKKGISGELTSIASGNANIIEESFRVLEHAAEGMQNYLEQEYPAMMQSDANDTVTNAAEGAESANGADNVSAAGNAEILPSILYPGHAFSTNSHDVEAFMIETCRSTIGANDNISAMGIMFEPYKFHDDMEAFGFWLDQSNLEATDIAFTSYTDYAQEDSYKYVIENKHAYLSLPYQNGSGQMVIAYGIPIVYNNEVIGVVISNLTLDGFSSVTTSSQNYPSMWITIYNDEGNIIWDSETLDDVGKNMQEFTPNQQEYEQIQTMMASKSDFYMEKTREDGEGVSCFYSPIQVGDYTWWSLTGLYSRDAHQSMVQTTVWLCVLSVIALVIVILVIIFVLRRMLAPVKYVVQAAETIAAGNLDIQIQTNRQDEIGDLYRAFQTMVENLKLIIGDVDYLLNEMANGNFDIRTRAEEHYVGNYQGILLAIRRINRSLSKTLSQINQAADQVSAGSEQVSSGAQALSQGAAEQASSVEQLAATIADISEVVQKNAKMAEAANTNVSQVNNNVAESGEKMKTTLAIMEDAHAQTTKVQGIIKTIEDIAFQTNILALNAAVEAARAGVAGKGFAVVADEVRNLASKSSEASKNTTALINGALSAIAEGTESMQETKQFVDNVVIEVEEITKVFEKISLASEQQASSIEQVTIGIDQISSVVQTNSATAEESAAASQELSGQADMLKELIRQFQLRDSSDFSESNMTNQVYDNTYQNDMENHVDMKYNTSMDNTLSKY